MGTHPKFQKLKAVGKMDLSVIKWKLSLTDGLTNVKNNMSPPEGETYL